MKTTLAAITLSAGFALAQEQIIFERKIGQAGKEPTVMFFSSGGESIKGSPYSADTITETTQVLADGNRIVRSNKSSFARDSEGRTRRDTEIHNFGPLGSSKEPATSTFINDPVQKVSYTLDARNKVALKSTRVESGGMKMRTRTVEAATIQAGNAGAFNTTITSASPVAGLAVAGMPVTEDITEVRGRIEHKIAFSSVASDRANLNTEDLGERNIEGVLAKGHRVRMKIPAGEVGNEREIEVLTETWTSSQLNTVVYSKHSDPRFGETVTRMTNVKLGEPPASLFDVPADYKVESVQNMRMPMPVTVVKE